MKFEFSQYENNDDVVGFGPVCTSRHITSPSSRLVKVALDHKVRCIGLRSDEAEL